MASCLFPRHLPSPPSVTFSTTPVTLCEPEACYKPIVLSSPMGISSRHLLKMVSSYHHMYLPVGTFHQLSHFASRFWYAFNALASPFAGTSANIHSPGSLNPPYWQSTLSYLDATKANPSSIRPSPRSYSHSYLYLTMYINPAAQRRCKHAPPSAKDTLFNFPVLS